MEYSQYDFPNELWYALPEWEITLKIATFVPVIALGVCGNWLLLVIIARNRALQTPTNLLLANMSAADLLTLAVCPVLFMFNNFYQDFRLGKIGCLAEGFLEGALLVTSVLNLCAVSYDRLTAIVLPTETRFTVRGAKLVMVGTWLAGAAFATPLAIFRFYRERQWRNYLESYCSENPYILPTYWHVLIGAIVWLPLTVMVACYSAILWKLDRYEAQVLRREHPICVSYKTRVAKTLFVVVLTFVVLRVPFTAMVFVRHNLLRSQAGINQVDAGYSVLWYTSHYLIFLHAAVNPLIYGLTNDNFRRAYSQTPLCWCNRSGGRKATGTAAKRTRAAAAGRRSAPASLQKLATSAPAGAAPPTSIRPQLQPRSACETMSVHRQSRTVVGGGALMWSWLNSAALLRSTTGGGSTTVVSTVLGSPSASKASPLAVAGVGVAEASAGGSVETVPGVDEMMGVYRIRGDTV